MTEQEIAGLGPAFSRYLASYRPCFGQARTAAHFATSCRGLLTDLPRKSVEPIALHSGTAVRTLQEFLVTSKWDQELALDSLQRRAAVELAAIEDAIGTVGLIDETSSRKWGDQTPGVQRQYLGCVGKVESGIVTVHVGVAKGTYSALLAADLYLPKSWADDRDRCRAAGIPDSLPFRPKWRIAALQGARLWNNGVRFDWLTFDEGYGASVPFLRLLGLAEQRFVAEVPVSFAVRDTPGGPSRRADERLSAADARSGSRYRVRHQTVADSVWRVSSAAVWVAGGDRRGHRRGEVLPDQRDRRSGPPGGGRRLPPLAGGTRLPPGQAGGGPDGRRGAVLPRPGPPPDVEPDRVGIRRRPYRTAPGGKTRS
jgi:SRSO17 transposase